MDRGRGRGADPRPVVELFVACRRGDIARVAYLVEQKEIELNVRDKWDSTPLYYACLCGHEELVQYLLENGAKCEANTFDGERCLYGALSNEIRSILRNYKAVTSSTIRRDLYVEFLRRLLDRRGCFEDIEFVVDGQHFAAHRCILSARCQYFSELLNTKWKDRSVISISSKMVTTTAFRAILQYLYTGHVEIAKGHLEDVICLAKHCRLLKLQHELEEKWKNILSFESTKPGVSVTVMNLEPSHSNGDLNADLGMLATEAMPIELCNQGGVELPFLPESSNTFSDVIFSVEGHFFHCHKAFFVGRSDYFRVLLSDHFGEMMREDEHGLPIVRLNNISPSVFTEIVYYIYQDSCQLTEQNSYDILMIADLYLLSGLKRQCAVVIGHRLTTENVVDVLRIARQFGLSRLENQCAEFMSDHMDEMVCLPEFAQLVQEDAKTVQHRQETDSIAIIDDIRFHITNYVQTYSDMYEADQKLAIIDAFLEELELDG